MCPGCGNRCECFQGRGVYYPLARADDKIKYSAEALARLASGYEQARAKFEQQTGFCCPRCAASQMSPGEQAFLRGYLKEYLEEEAEKIVQEFHEKAKQKTSWGRGARKARRPRAR